VRKPANVSFEDAASVPVAALTALQGLRNQGNIQAGQRVLIQGAGGGVGTFAVQIAKAFGADVTAVCGTRNLDVVRSLGADHIIDYTKEDFTKNGQRYDLILAANGYHPILDYRRSLSPNGVYVVVGGSFSQMLQALFFGTILNWFGSKKFRGMICRPTQADLEFLRELLESCKVVPAIDRCYPLSKLPEAIRYLMNGHAKGKVVITVAEQRAESAPTSAR
jgi:NADPH:quinone reductase-like Zn-dependent oxidoreductase